MGSTTDDYFDCSIGVPPQGTTTTFHATGEPMRAEPGWWEGPITTKSPEPVREVCTVVGGLHSCDGSPHTSLLPVSGDGEGAAVVVHEVRDNLRQVRLEGPVREG